MVIIDMSVEDRDGLLRSRLRAMHDLPLLSGGEELAAAATVADGRAAEYELAAIDESADHDGQLDLQQIDNLLERVRMGEDARELLVQSSRRLVVSLARRHDADTEGTEALLAAGDDALRRAADRYDPTGGLPFSAFAKWWVERAMRQVDRHPTSGAEAATAEPVDADVLTALGHLHADDCRVIELRLGLQGGPPLSSDDTALLLGLDADDEAEREERAVAKLRHPCTPGDLTHLRGL
jgi:DNA-directed RNA polymerase sigma subunit (sigma70/sigma32)